MTGGTGSGKTIFALQYLLHGAQHCREPGVFVAFEETPKRIEANAKAFGWNISGLRPRDLLHEWLLAYELTALITAKAGGESILRADTRSKWLMCSHSNIERWRTKSA